MASVPFIIWEEAVRDGYQLNSKDNKFAEKELFRFLKTHPKGPSCMVRDSI